MALLTVTAGVVEATSFLALGQVFTAFATGNLLFLAFALAGQGIVPAGRPAVALIAFIVGVALGSAVIRALGRRRWFPMALVTEAVLLGVAGVVALRLGIGSTNSGPPHPAVIALVALAMGLRSTAALRAAIPGMSTQMIQGSLVNLIDRFVAGRQEKRPPPLPNGWDLGLTRHSVTIIGTFVGGLLGALLIGWGAGPTLLAVAGTVLIIAAVYSLTPRYRRLAA